MMRWLVPGKALLWVVAMGGCYGWLLWVVANGWLVPGKVFVAVVVGVATTDVGIITGRAPCAPACLVLPHTCMLGTLLPLSLFTVAHPPSFAPRCRHRAATSSFPFISLYFLFFLFLPSFPPDRGNHLCKFCKFCKFASRLAEKLSAEHGYTLLHPFEDYDVIAGQVRVVTVQELHR